MGCEVTYSQAAVPCVNTEAGERTVNQAAVFFGGKGLCKTLGWEKAVNQVAVAGGGGGGGGGNSTQKSADKAVNHSSGAV